MNTYEEAKEEIRVGLHKELFQLHAEAIKILNDRINLLEKKCTLLLVTIAIIVTHVLVSIWM